MFCSECGAKNESGSKFCSECGSPLEVTSDTGKKALPQEKKIREPLSKKKKMVLGVFLLLIIIAGIGYKIGSDLTNPKAINCIVI